MRSDCVEFVCQLVRERAAIELDQDKEYLIESRLLRVANDAGFRTPDELVSSVKFRAFGEVHARIIEAMTTNETHFFRDTTVFDALESDILPALVAAKRPQRRLRIWSAASSTGQEIYSIAMMLRQRFPEVLDWNLELLATDINRDVVERGRAAEYNQIEISRGLPALYQSRFFEKKGTRWGLKREVRDMVTFRTMNLIGPWTGIGSVDLLLIRNVLIYFGVKQKRQVLERAKRTLSEDGILILGTSEIPPNAEAFERIPLGTTFGYRAQQRSRRMSAQG